MYYSSSSSVDELEVEDYENDDRLEERPPIHQHSIASYDEKSSAMHPTATSAINEYGAMGLGNDEGAHDVSLSLDTRGVGDDDEKRDDQVVISTLLLEEKIVSLMNRVWILETENDVLRSEWKTEDGDDHRCGDIESMYQNPYASPINANNDNDTNPRNVQEQKNSFRFEDAAATAGASPSLRCRVDVDKSLENSNYDKTTKSGGDPSSLAQQNRSLRRDLAISEEIQERMRVAMVSIENRDNLRSGTIEKLSEEQEDVAKKHKEAMESLQNRLEMEQANNNKLQADLEDEIQNKKDAEKECVDGSTVIIGNQPFSTAKAAQLISDLSNELRMTMERESKQNEELGVLRRQRKESQEAISVAASNAKQASASRDQLTRDIGALLEHNEELESLNIQLVRKLDDLEAECNALVANARKQERNNRIGTKISNSNNDDMVQMQEYLYSLSIKYEESQREVTSLKSRLKHRETTASELRAMSPPTRGPSQEENEILREPSKSRKQNDRIARIVHDKEEKEDFNSAWQDGVDFPPDGFAFPDEQREDEDEDFASTVSSFPNFAPASTLFPNRFEI